MLVQSFTKKSLLGATAIAGFAALLAVSPAAHAQSGQMGNTPTPTDRPTPTPGVAQPNSDDSPAADDQATEEAAAAQQAAPGEEDVQGSVVVTGSRIRRDPTNAPTPLIQVGRTEVLESGEPNIVDYLADIPALQNSVVPEDTTGAGLGDAGLSLLNLRNLGSERTLVLVDGRRHVGSDPNSPTSVDVDTIPRLLIQNIEVITGGASAQYGADAVAGVVNFLLRRDFEGVELDAALAEINQDGQLNRRVSGLIGRNFLGERLNLYFAAEYEQSDEVRDEDLDWRRRGCTQFQNDLDPNARTPDGVLDVELRCGFGTLSRLPGGTLTLATQTIPSPASDPDIPFALCPSTTSFSGNCFVVDPGRSFAFDNTGRARAINFGTFRPQAGLNRFVVIDSPDAQPLTAFRDSRLPESTNARFQTGFNLDITPSVSAFGELKYVKEENIDNFQPAFFNINVDARRNGARQTQIVGLNLFSIGTDNAFLDPALRTLIETNRRPVFNSAGVQTGTILDPRAQLINFTFELGGRPQDNTRELTRGVIGVRGEADRFLNFVNNFSWEIGYTHGEVEDENVEPQTVDAERYAYAADAVVDVNGVVNGQRGQIVCRVQLNAATGGTNLNIGELFNNGRQVAYSRTDPTIAGCVPIRLFGTEGYSDAAREYLLTSQVTRNRISQDDVLAFASGELFDPFGAGPIGVAVGYEYREEKLSGEFESPAENGSRFLFANAIADVPEVSFNVREFFAELRLPLLRERPLAELLEVSGSFRRSDYSRTGESDTYGFNVNYRPVRDILLRATKGVSIREPNLTELFQPASQTFSQLTDPCDVNVIRTTADPRIQANRIRNCQTNPFPGLGVPAGFTDPFPGSSNPGLFGGNTALTQEEADSFTIGAVFTPRFARGLSLVVDYFDIDVENAIEFLGAQGIVEQCFSLEIPNPIACATLSRDPDNFEINNFLEFPLNFALLRARGVDFGASYRLDLADMFDRDYGRLDFSLRGNYLIRRQNFTNPADPGAPTEIDARIGNPRVRFLVGTTYTLRNVALTWEVDYQTSQEIFDESVLANDPDNRRSELLESGAFTQHDFLARWDIRDNVRLRAGVINAFDAEPAIQAFEASAAADIFDFFGRRFYVGLNMRLGAAAR